MLFASFTSLEGGMNSGFNPAVIADNQYSLGVNVVSRNGRPHTRPDFDRMNLTFENSEEKDLFETGRFQGSGVYSPGAARYIVALINGWVFSINLSSSEAIRISNVPQMSDMVRRGYFVQVIDDFVIQDGINRPIILKNLSGRVSDKEKNEIPAGTVMAFGHGRLFMKISKRNFIAGDVYKFEKDGSSLKFTEDQYLSEGGAFSVQPELGEIVGMTFATNLDTSTGDGPLFVLCDNGVASYSVQNSRLLWNENDISKVQSVGTGFVGQDAKVDINQDIMFWSWGGLRSWAAIKQEAMFRRKYTNQSAEVATIIKDSTEFLYPFISMIHFNNRLLITAVGQKAKCKVTVPWSESTEEIYDDVSFRSIISLDFDQINNMVKGQASQNVNSASFDGIWTGLNPTQLLAMTISGKEKAYCFDKSRSGKNRLWEITDKFTGRDNGVHKIRSEVSTRAYVGHGAEYNDQPFTKKRLSSVRLWLAGILEPIKVELSIKNDLMNSFELLEEKQINVETWRTDLVESNIVTGSPQNRSGLAFENFTNRYDPVQGTLVYSGYELIFNFAWEGYAELSRMLAMMSAEGSDVSPESKDTLMVSQLPEDKYKYRI